MYNKKNKEQKYYGVETGYIREKDNACIPVCEDNSDFIELQRWIDEGNTHTQIIEEVSMLVLETN